MPDTGWFAPSGGTVSIRTDDSGVTPSNVSNIGVEDSNSLTVNLPNTGGTGAQLCKLTVFDWVHPVGFPSNAFVVGIEATVYIQYWAGGQDRAVTFWGLSCFSLWLRQKNDVPLLQADGDVAEDSGASPVTDQLLLYGGPTDLLGLDADTLVSDFLARNGFWDDMEATNRDSHFRIRCGTGGPGFNTALVTFGHIKLKIYYDTPPNIDMASGISFSVTVSPTITKVRDIASSIVFSGAISATIIYAVGAMSSAIVFDCLIATDISETGWIDSTAGIDFSVTLTPPQIVLYHNMEASSSFGFSALGRIGDAAPMSCSVPFGVTMDPNGLGAQRELQTDAVTPWFSITLNAPAPDGTIHLASNIPFNLSIDPDGMLVNWALFANPTINVSVAAGIDKWINMVANLTIDMSFFPVLSQNVNLAAAVTIDGLLFNSSFSKLPVPTLEERIFVIPPRDRTFVIPPRDRTFVLNSQQRNP